MEKRGRGRVAADGYKNLIQGNIRLTQEMWGFVQEQGGGDYNIGIRKLVASAMSSPAPMKSISKPVVRSRAAEEDPEQVARQKFLGDCQKLMRGQRLEYVGNGQWDRNGNRMNPLASVPKLYRDYPQLKKYAEIQDGN